MLGALLYLRFTSFKNWLRTRLKGLRQPKQLAGAIAFTLYFWFFFLRPWGASSARDEVRHATAAQALAAADVALPTDWLPLAATVGALALFVFTALMWIVPTQRAALGFTEAEIAFLFPAPIARRSLVHFRLLSGQLRSLVGATVMMLISNRWSFLGGNALTRALGWWFVFSALNLHYSGANFTLTRLADAGVGAGRRRALVLALVAATIAATSWRLPETIRPGAGRIGAPWFGFADWIAPVASTAPLGWILWPFKVVLGPFLASNFHGFWLALAPALLVIMVHYLWVVRAAVAFEDASIAFAQKRTARIAAWRSGRGRFSDLPNKARREPFRLAGIGRAEFAFLWKNLLSTWPYFNGRVFVGCAIAIVAGFAWLRTQPMRSDMLFGVSLAAGAFAAYVLVIGPQFARQDIRSDLAYADLLKTYPLPGWQIVLGELLAPVAILTGVLWLALLILLLALPPSEPRLEWLTPQLRIAGGASLAVLAPALVTLQLLVPSAAALVFPAWFQASRSRGGGPEVAGQRMIFFFAQLLTMALALLPAVGFAALLLFILWTLVGPVVAVGVAAVVVLAIVVGEVWCGLWLLGQRFERLDLPAELRP
ncbi:MAG: putative ABC exporter domain-containing protein [Opitutaceae bacterium]